METYTKEEVEDLLKNALSGTMKAFLKWLKEETLIVDITTKEVIDNAELTVKGDTGEKVIDYVSKSLEEMGIKCSIK
jgi:hypothetical protein